MTINELINIVDDYIIKPVVIFNIDLDSFNKQDGRKQYNKRIREKVQNKFGIYIWTNSQTDEIIYIGMAGKTKTNNSLSNHSLQKRLLASRGRDKKTKKRYSDEWFCKEIYGRKHSLAPRTKKACEPTQKNIKSAFGNP